MNLKSIKNYTVTQIKKSLQSKGLDTKERKNELIIRLSQHLNQPQNMLPCQKKKRHAVQG